ncbi:NAD(P)/FAD-dependent oxidoreductase [Rhodovibrionaceae bacterium A322]
MTRADLFTPDFKPDPYWWEEAPLVQAAETPLPKEADVVIIGAGYSGLHAAVQTARAGLATLVLEAELAGWGCSSRNGGQISTSIKPSHAALTRRYGADKATALLKEGQASLDYVETFVRDEKIDCAFEVVGRFHGAHTPGTYERLAREIEVPNPAFKTDAYLVPKSEQHQELKTDVYHGGVVFPRHASVDAGKYLRGILDVAEKAGAQVHSHSPVTELQRTDSGFLLTTPRGQVKAGKVILATNGYSGPLAPWHQRRVIPIGSYVIATEELDPALMDQLMPRNRILSDTRKLVYYYRPSPDRKRVLFGGRVSLNETNPLISGPKLHRELTRLLPDLKGTRISHSWSGTVAYTFDELMHCGEDKGLFYTMGYCGSGVGMASYLGQRMGQQAAGLAEGKTAFDDLSFQTRPLYSGNPWFLAPSIMVYRVRDRLGI